MLKLQLGRPELNFEGFLEFDCWSLNLFYGIHCARKNSY
jgi:hypothetical protein